LFIGCFDNSGQLLWYKENTTFQASGLRKAYIDDSSNIYLMGISSQSDTFNNHPTGNNPLGGVWGPMPVFMKLDSTGNTVWTKSAYGQDVFSNMAVTFTGTTMVVAGHYAGKSVFPGFDS